MSMNVESKWDGDVLTFEVEGRLDTNTSPEFIKTVKEEADKAEKVIFDLEGLTYISSAGIRVIVSTAKMMSERGGIVVRNLCDDVYEVFNLVGLTGILDIQ